MAEFGTAGKLSKPETQFTQVQARERPDPRSSQISTLAKGATIAGKAFARGSAAELSGGDLSQADVNIQADTAEEALDNQITDAMVAGGGTLSGSTQEMERSQIEIKDAALTEFADNDRVLLELRDRGVISTIEARGRRQLNLKRSLSNPINALFKGEFLNAAKSLTGGAKGAVGEIFPFTKEELLAQSVSAEKTKAVAENEGRIAGLVAATGRPDAVMRQEVANQTESELQLKSIERTKQQRALNGEEFASEHGLLRSSAARGLMLEINKLSSGNGGNGLDANSMVIATRTLDQQYRGMLEAIRSNLTASASINIGQAERDAEVERLNEWRTGMTESLKEYDASTLDANRLVQLEQLADKLGWQHFADFKFLDRINPKIAEIGMLQGNFDNLDAFTRKGVSGGVSSAVAGIKAATQFSLNKPPENIDVAGIMIGAITAGGTTAGLEYVSSPEVQGDNAKKINLAKIYNATPEVVLQAYSTTDAQRLATTSPEFRGEINKAMQSGLRKMNTIKEMIGAQDEVIFAEPQILETTGGFGVKGQAVVGNRPGRNPNWILNLPDGMQEHAQDLRSMHSLIVKQPWSWSHVKEDYVDGSDSFNGYMRGEWDVNVELLDGKGGEESAPTESRFQSPSDAVPQDQSFVTATSVDRTEDTFQPVIPEGKEVPIAVENNNPGNLRALGVKFQGKSGEVDTASGKFSTFKSPEMGMRALARDLSTKIKGGLNTIDGIIKKYAPDSDPENQLREHSSQNYVDFVVRTTGIDADKTLKLGDRAELMDAITRFEAGFQPWTRALIEEGIRLAGDGE